VREWVRIAGTDECDRREGKGVLDRGEEEPVLDLDLDLDDNDNEAAPPPPPPPSPDVSTEPGTARLALLVPGLKRPASSCRSLSWAAKSLLEEDEDEEEMLAASSCINSAPTSGKEPLSTLKWTPGDLMDIAGIGTGTTETHMIQAQAIPNCSVWITTNEGLGLKNVYTSGWAATGVKGVLT